MKHPIKATLIAGATLLLFNMPAMAETYPERTIKMIVPYSAGGPTDGLARLVAEQLGTKLGKVITVINKPGGDNLIAAREVISSKPDGYTIFFTTNGLLSIAPAINKDYPIDTLKDFSYIGSMSAYPYVFVTGTHEKRNSLEEFIQASRQHPESVSYAVVGNVSMVTGALFTETLNIKMLPVRYKGNADTVSDLFAERLNIGTFAPSFSMPLIDTGKIKPLAVTGVSRLKQLPNLPLISELNPELEEFSKHAMVWTALVTPANVPENIKKKLSTALKEVMADKDMIEKVEKQGDIVLWKDAEETLSKTKAEMQMWKGVAAKANL